MPHYTFDSILPPQVKAHKEGRVCKYPGCSQVLSVYNPHKHCYVHFLQLLIEDAIKAEPKLMTVTHGR